MTEFYRDSPIPLWQEGSTCWAAATEAWTAVTRGQEHLSYIEILDEAKAAKATAWNGSLRGDDGVKWLANRFNLQLAVGHGSGRERLDASEAEEEPRDLHVPQAQMETIGPRGYRVGNGRSYPRGDGPVDRELDLRRSGRLRQFRGSSALWQKD